MDEEEEQEAMQDEEEEQEAMQEEEEEAVDEGQLTAYERAKRAKRKEIAALEEGLVAERCVPVFACAWMHASRPRSYAAAYPSPQQIQPNLIQTGRGSCAER